jgi:hypothetical protein
MDPSAEHGQVPRGSGAGPVANGPTERRRGDRLPSFAQQPAFPLEDAGFPLQPRATSSQTGQPSWDAGGPFDPGNSVQQPTGLPQGHSPHAQHQLPGYRPQLGSPWRQPQRSGPLPQAPTSSGPLGAYGWLPYPVYGDHTGQPNFFPDNYMAHYPFMYHGAPDFQNFAFGSIQGLPHAVLGDQFSPNMLRLPFGRGRPPRTSKPPEEPNENYDFDLDEALNHPERARKTLMLRNIPNKYTIHMLLETLNKCHRSTSPGQLVYDFCYLPIDFKNRCNLGYAFVNFVDAAFAAECYMAFNAKRWNDFNSKKVCEVKYARVQGKEALIEHFKNSKFPGNDIDCLPLLFEQETSESGEKTVRSIPLYSRQLHPGS